MSIREFYIQRQKAEAPVFLKVMRALPPDQLAYKPHERSPSAQQLVWTLTAEMQACLSVINENKAEWEDIAPPPFDDMLAIYERVSDEVLEKVASMDDQAWNQTARFYYGGQVVSEQPVGNFLWSILFDSIHHRGQLSAYLRPMGANVPSIYGPSADDPGK
jgi:uncharacterized damage-inducible protein DinB